MISIQAFNELSDSDAYSQIEQACCADRWIDKMLESRPFDSVEALLLAADEHWSLMQEDDYLHAFEGHPKIGDVSSLKEKYRNTQGEASHEQSGVDEASDAVIGQLAASNQAYLDKFGFIFIVFASGKSAQQMLDLLLQRMVNDRQQELINAAQEQAKITRFRLQKMFNQR